LSLSIIHLNTNRTHCIKRSAASMTKNAIRNNFESCNEKKKKDL